MSARFAWERGDFAQAGSRFEALSNRNPDRTAWIDAAISAHLGAGDPDAALRVAQTCRRGGLTGPAHEARLVLAADALRHRRWREAEELLGGAATDVAHTATFRLAAGLLHVWAAAGRGDSEAALARLRVLPRSRAITLAAPFQQAMLLESARRFAEADIAYEAAAEGDAVWVEGLLSYAAYLERRRGLETSRAYLESLRGLLSEEGVAAALTGRYRPPASSPHRNAALGLVGLGRGLAAEDAAFDAALVLSLALVADPDLDSGRLFLAAQLHAMGQNDRARATAEAVASGSVYEPAAQIMIAELIAANGHTEEALARIQGLAAQTPSLMSMVALAHLALEVGANATAEEAFSWLIARDAETPVDWRVWLGRARVRERLGHWLEAQADIRRALALQPDQPVLLIAQARSLLRNGGAPEEALGLMERAYRADPRGPATLTGMGEASLAVGRLEDAVAFLDQALRSAPGDAGIAESLGDALWRLGDRRRARYMWSRALSRVTDEGARAVLAGKLDFGLDQAP
jgi:tetratricopeptide (TPR) repeat protein